MTITSILFSCVLCFLHQILYAHMGDWVSISLGIIQIAPTRWVLAFFQGFMIFWSNAPKFRPIALGGGYVYTFEICEKRPFQKCMGGAGGWMITFLSKWSCKVDDAQDRAMLEGPLIIPNPNRPHCCPFPHGRDPIGAHIPLLVN